MIARPVRTIRGIATIQGNTREDGLRKFCINTYSSCLHAYVFPVPSNTFQVYNFDQSHPRFEEYTHTTFGDLPLCVAAVPGTRTWIQSGLDFDGTMLSGNASRIAGEAAMRRALVIDDDRSIGEAIQTMLARHGYNTALALNSGDGIQLFESSSFDVVIVDIFMPGTDGFETIKSLREQAPRIPIIAISGYGFRNSMSAPPDFLTMAVELGATSCLRKPFTFQQLMAAIDSSYDQALPHHSMAN